MPVTFLTPEDLQPINDEQQALEARVASLEAVPPPVPFDPSALQASIAALEARVTALEPVPPPPPPPPPPVTFNLRLLGGWRLYESYSRGVFAIDFATMTAYVAGHTQYNTIVKFPLPAYGAGDVVANYPQVLKTETIESWWPSEDGKTNGLVFENGRLLSSPRKFYDMTPPSVTKIYASDGEVITVNVPRQKFSGFVKSPTGWELGCGGYESGQGTSSGPTLATVAGVPLIGSYDSTSWETRCPREPNYYPHDGVDSWACYAPRNGEGRWASDKIMGGGIRHSTGIYYWPLMGIGAIDYGLQNECFSLERKTYMYRYDPATYQLIGWQEFPIKKVAGQEISPDGRYVYLMCTEEWGGGPNTSPVLRVYEVE